MDGYLRESMKYEARQFATDQRIIDLVRTRTTMDLGMYEDQTFQNLCAEIRGRFVRLVLRGSDIEDATILHAINSRPIITPKGGRKTHGKPGMGEKAAKSSD